jgi:pimeloyl-ACP methyl ester carboxylesterase
MRELRLILAACVVTTLLVGCASENEFTSATDTQSEDSGVLDISPSDSGAEDVPLDIGWSPGPIASEDEHLEIPIGQWMVTTFPDYASTAEIRAAVEQGNIQVPDMGFHYGSLWSPFAPGENGQIKLNGFGSIIYAITQIDVNDTIHAVAKPKGAAQVIVANRRQPGDIYMAGKHVIPLTFDPGKNILVVMAYRRNAPPEFLLHTTSHEMVFNKEDVTFPTLRAGKQKDAPIGIPVLNATQHTIYDGIAKVISNGVFADTEVALPPLGPQTVTQIPFSLSPGETFPSVDETEVTAILRVESPSLQWSYETELPLTVKASDFDGAERYTFRSTIDDSVQYFGLRRPTETTGDTHALVLSLHGASVEAVGQAASYSAKPDVTLVAPTNRRPFGFDWESFGRLDALEILNLAQEVFPIDPTRVYLTGHSMGGHGSWQLGTLFPGRFAVVGPSAGWISFATYSSKVPFSTGPFGWASHSADTIQHVANLEKKGVYIIHGTADDNVPIEQAETMHATLKPFVEDLYFHKEIDAGHWWDGDVSPGADCVDWPPLFELMAERFLDPFELDFFFISPSPAVSPTHSYVTVKTAFTPAERVKLTSKKAGDTVTLTAENAIHLELNGEALQTKGITTVVVNGESFDVTGDTMVVGTPAGKTPEAYGPLVQVFYRPFCIAYGEENSAWQNYASYLVSSWNLIGNGQACALPISQVTEELLAAKNIIYVGVMPDQVPFPSDMPVDWNADMVSMANVTEADSMLAFVFPHEDRLGAVLTTTQGSEHLLFRIQPFNSRFWVPDYLILGDGGAATAGFFNSNWQHTSTLAVP